MMDSSTRRMTARGIVRAGLCALAFSLLPALGGGSMAADRLNQGIKVGEPIPHQLDAPDQTGIQRSFRSLVGRNGLVVMFSRSFDW